MKGGEWYHTTQRKSPAGPPCEPHKGRSSKGRRNRGKHSAGVHERPGIFGEIPGSVWNLVQDATRQAQQALALAISTLTEIMGNTDEQATARIQAARSTLEYALKLTEQTDILEQLRELERWKEETDGKH